MLFLQQCSVPIPGELTSRKRFSHRCFPELLLRVSQKPAAEHHSPAFILLAFNTLSCAPCAVRSALGSHPKLVNSGVYVGDKIQCVLCPCGGLKLWCVDGGLENNQCKAASQSSCLSSERSQFHCLSPERAAPGEIQ